MRLCTEAHRYFHAARTFVPPTYEQLAGRLKDDRTLQPFSLSTIHRLRRRYPGLLPPKITRAWLEHEAQRYGWDPPPDPVELHARERTYVHVTHGGAEHLVEVEIDKDGLLRALAPLRNASAALVAVVFGFGILDVLSDGRLDGVVRWCHLLARATHIVV